MRQFACTLLSMAILLTGCGEQTLSEPDPEPQELFSCSHLLIGLETVFCHEDVIGPGTLNIAIRPDPKETSWEISISGLAALAEQCEFHGQFDQTRLAALQGRGDTEIVCAIAAEVDRQYHELRFENRIEATNTSLRIQVRFVR